MKTSMHLFTRSRPRIDFHTLTIPARSSGELRPGHSSTVGSQCTLVWDQERHHDSKFGNSESCTLEHLS